MFTFTILVTLVTSVVAGQSPTCDDPTISVCSQLYKDIESALTKDEENLFRIRRTFFHSPTAAPVLLRVIYNVTFRENLTTAVASEETSLCSNQILQNSTIDINQTEIIMGWTSSGVYTMFHPAVLSVMQVQSPFAFLRIIQRTLHEQKSPEANTFLWDGSYDLPTLHLNMHITSLTCLPSKGMFDSVLEDLNTLLKLYGGSQEIISIAEHTEFLGFTLPATSVSRKIIPIGSDVIYVNLYSSMLCFLYIIAICIVTFWYFQPSSVAKETVDTLINRNAELSIGLRTTSTPALGVEVITRFAVCIIWTCNMENTPGIILAIWMPQIHLLIVAAVQITVVSVAICYNEGKCQIESPLRTFTNLCATAFMLFYLLFPAIILMFAYPTQIIVIFTFVTAYLFATTIFFASVIKLCKLRPKEEDQQTKNDCCFHCCHFLSHCCDFKKWCSKACRQRCLSGCQNCVKTGYKKCPLITLFIFLWLVIVYLHFLAVFASYSMLIGRGSVINTGPLFLISLLPSIILSGGAWVAKRVAFKGKKQTSENAATENMDTDMLNEIELLNKIEASPYNSVTQSSSANNGTQETKM